MSSGQKVLKVLAMILAVFIIFIITSAAFGILSCFLWIVEDDEDYTYKDHYDNNYIYYYQDNERNNKSKYI